MKITIDQIDIKDYLINNTSIISTKTLLNRINDNKDLLNKDLLNKISSKKEEYKLSGESYHTYYLKRTNQILKNIIVQLKKEILQKETKKYKSNIENKITFLKNRMYFIHFDLPYKKLFNEEYPLEYIPSHKINDYYKENKN